MKTVRYVLVDDDQRYADVLREAFEEILPSWECVAQWANGVQFLCGIADVEAEIALIDINMPKVNGIECLRELKALKPDIIALMVTVSETEERIVEAIASGADGYLLKGDGLAELADTVQGALLGRAAMSGAVARMILRRVKESAIAAVGEAEGVGDANGIEKLTDTEYKVLKRLSEGMTYKEAAEALDNISVETVKTHTKAIYRKLQVNNKTEAAAVYHRHNGRSKA